MAVLGPGRVSMAFPEPVRSFFTPQCPKPTHLDPLQPKNYIFLGSRWVDWGHWGVKIDRTGCAKAMETLPGPKTAIKK